MTTNWTVTVEEDPDTGDLILPLPQDMLNLQGWVEVRETQANMAFREGHREWDEDLFE